METSENQDAFQASYFTFTEETEGVPDHGSLHYLLGLNLPLDHQDPAEGHESIKAKVNAIRNKLVQQVRGKNMDP